MPLDCRSRPVYVFTGSGCKITRIVVWSDGYGNAYDCGDNPLHGTPRMDTTTLILPELIRFDCGLSGMDF